MDADLIAAEDDQVELKGSTIIAAIKASGVEFILLSSSSASARRTNASALPPASRIATGAR